MTTTDRPELTEAQTLRYDALRAAGHTAKRAFWAARALPMQRAHHGKPAAVTHYWARALEEKYGLIK